MNTKTLLPSLLLAFAAGIAVQAHAAEDEAKPLSPQTCQSVRHELDAMGAHVRAHRIELVANRLAGLRRQGFRFVLGGVRLNGDACSEGQQQGREQGLGVHWKDSVVGTGRSMAPQSLTGGEPTTPDRTARHASEFVCAATKGPKASVV